MEDRLLRAASALNRELFEQFNGSYKDFALNTVKAITRGGDPANYNDKEIIDDMIPLLEKQKNEFTIQVEKLPCTIPYINFDVPNQEIDELRHALAGVKKLSTKFPKRYFDRLEKYQNQYQTLLNVDKVGWYEQFPQISYELNKEGMRNNHNLDDLKDNNFLPVF